MKRIDHSVLASSPPDEVVDEIMREIAPALARWGYTPAWHPKEDSVSFHYRARPVWVYVVAIVLFPIGLLALLLPPDEGTLIVEVDGEGTGSRVRVSGAATRRVQRAIEGMAFS